MDQHDEIRRVNLNAFCVRQGWVSARDPGMGSPKKLCELFGRTPSFWSDRLRGVKPIKAPLAREIEDGLPDELLVKFELDWTEADRLQNAHRQSALPDGEINPQSKGLGRLGVARNLSHPEGDPPIIKLEEPMKSQLPDVFIVELVDAVFSPHLQPGDRIVFKASRIKPAQVGDIVLLRAGDGTLFPRRLGERGPKTLIAFAPNAAFAPIELNDGAFEIVGTMEEIRAAKAWF